MKRALAIVNTRSGNAVAVGSVEVKRTLFSAVLLAVNFVMTK